MQKITPFLWFNNNAAEALHYYTRVFKNSRIISQPPQAMMLELEGQELILFNGGPHYQFTPAISLFIRCENQSEIDELWEKLLADGGKPNRCGWLQDKYGLSWQLVPPQLFTYLQDKDPIKAKRVMDAMLQMDKLDIATLQKAHADE
jgi:predicted 3-demethylubiquinone-9 3-methyltransferase (glyoxalase superfamily)